MTDLQIILLISSGVFLAGLYWWGKKTREQHTIRSQNLRQHGFRAETPEEEGMEVTLQPTSPRSANPTTRVAPAVTVSAREALARASGQAAPEPALDDPHLYRGRASVPTDVSTSMAAAPTREQSEPSRPAMATARPANAIQGVMNHHSDPYLEERFALSDPVTPRQLMQAPGHQGHHQASRDYGTHHLSDTHLPDMPFDDAGHVHSSYGRQHHDHHHYDHRHYDDYRHDGHHLDEEPVMEPSLPAQIFALLVIDPIRSFSRRDIHNAMLGAGLAFSSNGVYVFADKQGNPIFRVANVNEPGYFPDLEDDPDEFSTVGVALVLELPAAVTPYRAMNEFITAARRISQSLGGNLYDAQRRLIKESHLREMREYAQSIT